VQKCEVLIVGGGPAGSACAWKLRRAGLDVLVVDKSEFPRHKVCAGWITPQVVDDLEIDVDEYGRTRTFQPITSFRVGIVDREEIVEATYARPVSYGIRRCEFDDFLLKRSRARLMLGGRVSQLRRDGDRWIVNDEIYAAVLVGDGGHFCPVAKHVGGFVEKSSVVAAREVEFQIEDATSLAVAGECPELYFC
jgi:flavin-dependent dehydrogenase